MIINKNKAERERESQQREWSFINNIINNKSNIMSNPRTKNEQTPHERAYFAWANEHKQWFISTWQVPTFEVEKKPNMFTFALVKSTRLNKVWDFDNRI